MAGISFKFQIIFQGIEDVLQGVINVISVEKLVILKRSVADGNPKIFSNGKHKVSIARVGKLSQRQLIAARRQTQIM